MNFKIHKFSFIIVYFQPYFFWLYQTFFSIHLNSFSSLARILTSLAYAVHWLHSEWILFLVYSSLFRITYFNTKLIKIVESESPWLNSLVTSKLPVSERSTLTFYFVLLRVSFTSLLSLCYPDFLLFILLYYLFREGLRNIKGRWQVNNIWIKILLL